MTHQIQMPLRQIHDGDAGNTEEWNVRAQNTVADRGARIAQGVNKMLLVFGFGGGLVLFLFWVFLFLFACLWGGGCFLL